MPNAVFEVLQTTCPDGFSLSDVTLDRSPIEFVVMADGEGGSSWEGIGEVPVACVSDSDGDPFPFNASQIEFDVAPDGVVTGSATWSDSVGLSMNALISGSIDNFLDNSVAAPPTPCGNSFSQIVMLTLAAPNGDTLSEIGIAACSV